MIYFRAKSHFSFMGAPDWPEFRRRNLKLAETGPDLTSQTPIRIETPIELSPARPSPPQPRATMASLAGPEPDPDPNPWTADEPAAPTAPLLAPEPAPSPPTPPPAALTPPPADPRPVLEHAPPPAHTAALDAALRFLSTATPGQVTACLAALAALTYAVLGRVGLLLIGVAGGVVLHATWDGAASASPAQEGGAAAERWRRDVGLEVARRALEWRDGLREEELVEKVEVVDGRVLGYAEFPPETSAALAELTDAVVRDYVKYDLP